MSKKQIIIIVAIVLVVALSVWYFIYTKKVTEQISKTPTPPINTPSVELQSFIESNFPLQIGSTGSKVKTLQRAINKIDNRANLAVDGAFGNHTKDSLQSFVGFSYYPVTEEKYNYIVSSAEQF